MDSGVGFHVGQFDVAISGEINAFYVHDRADNSDGLTSTLGSNSQSQGSLCGFGCLASVGAEPSSSFRNGLLPGDLSFKISTQERGWDASVFFGIWPEIQSISQTGGIVATNAGKNGAPNAFGTAGVDFRQQFATLGRAHLGTIKFGRDLGLFGQEAILNDMTLLGAGSPNGNVGPGSVTLGRIGLGYIYTDFIPQITYTTPSARGLQAAFGVLEPFDDPLPNLVNSKTTLDGHGQPQFQVKLAYKVPSKGKVKTNFWVNGLTQSLEANYGNNFGGLKPGQSIRGAGVDYGAKLSFHGLDLVGYGYNGKGIGTEALMFGAVALNNAGFATTRTSQGYYFQPTFTAHKATFGYSYGQSILKAASGVDAVSIAGVLTRCESSHVAQFRYAATKWNNLVAEYTHTRSEAQGGAIATSDSVALGTIVFF
jgi:hypothetical protein